MEVIFIFSCFFEILKFILVIVVEFGFILELFFKFFLFIGLIFVLVVCLLIFIFFLEF